jgi:hypothetical protein
MTSDDPSSPLSEDEQKKLALELILDAWDTGLARGVQPEMLASTAIYAALTDMIDIYGVDAVAQLCEGLPERIREGEFTLADEAG